MALTQVSALDTRRTKSGLQAHPPHFFGSIDLLFQSLPLCRTHSCGRSRTPPELPPCAGQALSGEPSQVILVHHGRRVPQSHTTARTSRTLPLQSFVRLQWRLAGRSRRVPQLQPEKSRRAALLMVAGVTFSARALMSLDVTSSEGEQLGTPPLSGLAAMASTVNKTSPAAGAV